MSYILVRMLIELLPVFIKVSTSKRKYLSGKKYLCCYHDDFFVLWKSVLQKLNHCFLFSNTVDTILRFTIEVGGNEFCLTDTHLGETSYL